MISIIIIIICIILSGYFSATETAFSSLNKIRIKTLADKGNKSAKLVNKLNDKYDSLLSTILVGNNIVNILSASVSTLLFIKWFGESEGPTLSTIVMTIIVLIFGEITPKNIAKEHPEKFAMFSARLINFFMIILTPINYLFKLWKKFISLFIKSSPEKGMTEEELVNMIDEIESDGEIDKDESELIKNAIEFNELEVRDILTPRVDITALDITSSNKKICDLFTSTGYSRIPIYKDTIDNVIGILYYKDFFKNYSNEILDIEPLLKPCMYVTKRTPINFLLKKFQEKKLHLAIVLDEFGQTLGLVTLEDILEEIVGEIWDEHEKIIEELTKVSEKHYRVSGKANVEKILEELNIDADPEAITVNGWILNYLGTIPQENQEFETKGIKIKVLKMNGKRVDTIDIFDKRKKNKNNKDGD